MKLNLTVAALAAGASLLFAGTAAAEVTVTTGAGYVKMVQALVDAYQSQTQAKVGTAFGGNIIATIINPDCRPQMATVREGVMKKEVAKTPGKGVVKKVDHKKYTSDADFVVRIIEREMEERKINIKGAPVIIAGGYGMGCKENFALLHELAEVLGGEVGASRAAVDAGMADHARQIGQTGVTVRPKLYIACGISGQIQHTAGMDGSSMIISINTDPEAPINKIADYAIMGDVMEVVPKMIKYYKQNSK
jgi:electron transfer flavoprotein alpha subunit